jgi:hypothetical protein
MLIVIVIYLNLGVMRGWIRGAGKGCWADGDVVKEQVQQLIKAKG